MFKIYVLPFEAKVFSPPQASGRLHVVHLEDAALFSFPQKRGQLFDRQSFYLFILQLWQGTTLLWITGDDLVDVPHCFGAQAFGLSPALNSVHLPLFQ